jgi:hypothetical protein
MAFASAPHHRDNVGHSQASDVTFSTLLVVAQY